MARKRRRTKLHIVNFRTFSKWHYHCWLCEFGGWGWEDGMCLEFVKQIHICFVCVCVSVLKTWGERIEKGQCNYINYSPNKHFCGGSSKCVLRNLALSKHSLSQGKRLYQSSSISLPYKGTRIHTHTNDMYFMLRMYSDNSNLIVVDLKAIHEHSWASRIPSTPPLFPHSNDNRIACLGLIHI